MIPRIILAALCLPGTALACKDCKSTPPTGPVVEYDLTIATQDLHVAGKTTRALTLNGGIPGPVLRFREGDVARIRVHNRLSREETSIHWHGLLLPNEQDGVPHVTTPPIQPGTTHTFQFALRHSGTYWYHSHTHLQEQLGVYGAIVVLPREGEPVKADREEVVVLSDWTNVHPNEVMRMLMRGTEYFGIKRGNAQSITGALREGRVGDYFRREWDKMLPMDLSDVGYDAFWMNGQPALQLGGKPGERIRFRIINASAATYWYLHSSAGPMTIVAADGPAVEPVEVDRFLMAIAETYDVIVTVPASGEYELRATAQDGSGHASAFFGSGQRRLASDPPKADLYQMDEMLNLALEEQEDDPRASLQLPRPGSPYRLLKATSDTSLPKDLPRRTITLHLTGDMDRYVWSINGKTMAQEPYITIKKGEIIQLELINDSMMHHPIHLHGHFFRLLMGNGKRSPLKHTVDVPPMSKRVLEFEANEEKDWLLHCHILYHMMSGMGRVFRYESKDVGHGHQGTLGEHGHDMSYVWATASLQSHLSEGLLQWMNPRNDVLLAWQVGWENVEEVEYEVDLLYQRYFNADLQIFTGARLTNEDDAENRLVAGVQYRLPLFAWVSASVDSEGDARFSLAKSFQITPRLSLFGEVEYDTGTQWEWSAGADYLIHRNLSLITQYHSDFGLGAGVQLRF
jgi:FtsP/CotA-like multicopper oxidase with cupredoxin domain